MAKDPYRYFRVEARELLEALGRAALALERGAHGPELVPEMLRFAHTLKGAAHVVGRGDIAEAAHAIEETVALHRRTAPGAVPRDDVDRLLRSLDGVSALVAGLAGPAGAQGAPHLDGAPPAETLPDTRLDGSQIDGLLEDLLEAEGSLGALAAGVDGLSSARSVLESHVSPVATRGPVSLDAALERLDRTERSLRASLDDCTQAIGQVRTRAGDLRLVPAGTAFAMLERAVRDAAQQLGKNASLEMSGGEHRLEGAVLSALRDALLHVVRNAVAHGIESPAERAAAGKPASGRVRLVVQRRGGRIAFTCEDDGRGIDTGAVRRAAISMGVVDAARGLALEDADVHRLVLESGLTTTATVGKVAGRGVGMDVVRATVLSLNGDVTLSSQPGRGTTVDITVPTSLSSFPALIVEAANQVCSVPLDSVKRTLRLHTVDVSRTPEGDSVCIDGERVPFLPLAAALGLAESDSGDVCTAALLRAGSRTAAIGVERLVGTGPVVLRSLPRLAGRVPGVAGASLDERGQPRLVLDPRALVDIAHEHRSSVPSPRSRARAPVLVIDDSLTTRMLEKNILECAGYAVDVATSAEEGLVKARSAEFSLFLVDVEMPGMNGFEFVATTRADPVLREVPAILVTSRGGADDRRRGQEVGASAYIVKGEFDQSFLLQTLRRLVG